MQIGTGYSIIEAPAKEPVFSMLKVVQVLPYLLVCQYISVSNITAHRVNSRSKLTHCKRTKPQR